MCQLPNTRASLARTLSIQDFTSDPILECIEESCEGQLCASSRNSKASKYSQCYTLQVFNSVRGHTLSVSQVLKESCVPAPGIPQPQGTPHGTHLKYSTQFEATQCIRSFKNCMPAPGIPKPQRHTHEVFQFLVLLNTRQALKESCAIALGIP